MFPDENIFSIELEIFREPNRLASSISEQFCCLHKNLLQLIIYHGIYQFKKV